MASALDAATGSQSVELCEDWDLLVGDQSLLEALLEDPTEVLAESLKHAYDSEGEGSQRQTTYQCIDVLWSRVDDDGDRSDVLHERSQPFVRPLLGDRKRTFRLHRFTLSSHASLDEQLVTLALRQREEGPGVVLSNVGGFHSKQNLFDEPQARQLRDICAESVRRAAAAVCAEAGAPAPLEGSEPCGWSNVSSPGSDLNQLHCHSRCYRVSSDYYHIWT